MINGILRLTTRSILRIHGAEAEQFLQGLITKDINCINITGAIYAFLLNAKGRILFDLLVYKHANFNGLLVESDARRMASLEKVLKMYRLRRKIDIDLCQNNFVHFSTERIDKHTFEDPRTPNFGYRVISDNQSLGSGLTKEDYLDHRLDWGIAEGYDEIGDQIPLQANGDYLNGISFEKGCYIGQELIARTHHTGVIRRRVLPFCSTKKVAFGGVLMDESGKKRGKILKIHGKKGLALISLEHISKPLYDEAKNTIEVFKPPWWPSKNA